MGDKTTAAMYSSAGELRNSNPSWLWPLRWFGGGDGGSGGGFCAGALIGESDSVVVGGSDAMDHRFGGSVDLALHSTMFVHFLRDLSVLCSR